ncbi:MAG: 2-C-methyl-D-erythritol 2,4-cyclodiphosphate synthase [Armatimonas sp.]
MMRTATTTARVCALIPAAGRGVRFGAAENKVFTPLLGRPLLGWTLSAFAECAAIEAIVLVGSEGELDRLKEIGDSYGGGKVYAVVPGGSTRQESVKFGLNALPENCTCVVVHDAARCCVTPELIESALRGTEPIAGYCTLAIPVSDSLTRLAHNLWYDTHPDGGIAHAGESVSREGLWRVQTPQAFRSAENLRAAHQRATEEGIEATDDFSLLGSGGYIKLGSAENIKVTTPEDLRLAEAILRSRMQQEIRVGHGYDVHRLTTGRPMWLGGVHFTESPLGLEGHSDADAPLHALCDALLGAAGLPDIGQLFPPSDMAHKNRASIEFVQEVRARLEADGWSVANVDLTIIAEAPKIGPRTAQMKVAIADALHIKPVQVSIKATTNEGMGFVGRSEGIAAHASALISRRGS